MVALARLSSEGGGPQVLGNFDLTQGRGETGQEAVSALLWMEERVWEGQNGGALGWGGNSQPCWCRWETEAAQR